MITTLNIAIYDDCCMYYVLTVILSQRDTARRGRRALNVLNARKADTSVILTYVLATSVIDT